MKHFFIFALLLILVVGCGGGGNKQNELYRTQKEETTFIMTSNKNTGEVLYHLVTDDDSVMVRDKDFDKKFNQEDDLVDFFFTNEEPKLEVWVLVNGEGKIIFALSEIEASKILEDRFKRILEKIREQALEYFNNAINF